jgi:hypothetical protein
LISPSAATEQKPLDKPKIFVSYSHRDPKALQELARFLNPLGREGLIVNWTDNQIKSGEDWHDQIDQALATATVAVLLVSQDFLNSDFIFGTELPRILARADAGEMTVLPIFLKPFDTALEIPFIDRRGVQRKDKITRLQGLGTPDKPLSKLGPAERDRVYIRLAQRLRELAKEAKTPITSTPPTPSTTSSHRTVGTPLPPSGLHPLTVHLERRGPALDIRYYLPGMEVITSTTHSWQDVLAARGDPQGALFALLFGAETEWEPVFRRLFQQPAPQPRPNPIRAPVRLRVCTEEALLLGLPWGLTTWNHYPLTGQGWEFTTTGVVDPTEDCATSTPCPVLVVAPVAAGGVVPDPHHPPAIIDTLRQICPTGRQADYVRHVRTRAELENAVRGMRPHLVYVCACGTRSDNQPGLLLDDGWLSLSELAGWFRQYPPPPAALFLNVIGLTDSGLTPGQALGGNVPLVIWRRVSEWEADAGSLATQWLYRWLQKGEDPVAALHAVDPQAHLTAHSRYRTWQTTVHPAAWRERLARLVLDRDEQKALVGKHLKELARSDSRRIMALVAYAAPGNLLDALPEQLQHYLDLDLADLAEINWKRVQFPELRNQLQDDLEAELKLQLHADPEEAVAHLLRRHAPCVVGSGKRAVLWLNWGTFGQGADQQKPLDRNQLEQWLQFCGDFLSRNCPTDLRVVCYAAIETAENNHPRLAKILQECGWQPWCRRPEFRLSVLPPLGKVSESHLYDFLVDGQSHCDPGIQAEVTQRLIGKTGGDFEPLVASIEEAEQGGSWYALLTCLQSEQGVTPAADDEPF